MAQLLRGHARDTSAQARPGAGDAGAASFSGDLPSLGSHLRFTDIQPAEVACLSRRRYSFLQNKKDAKQSKKTLKEKKWSFENANCEILLLLIIGLEFSLYGIWSSFSRNG